MRTKVYAKHVLGNEKLPWEMTLEEFTEKYQKGPEVREDYASAWVPIKHPRGKPNEIEFTPYPNSKGAGVYRLNDENGIGIAILAIDDEGRRTDIAVQKKYRGKGLAQKLLDRARQDGHTESGSQERNLGGVKSVHRNEVATAISKGLPVPENVLKDYPDLRGGVK